MDIRAAADVKREGSPNLGKILGKSIAVPYTKVRRCSTPVIMMGVVPLPYAVHTRTVSASTIVVARRAAIPNLSAILQWFPFLSCPKIP